jgi:protein SCO1/2
LWLFLAALLLVAIGVAGFVGLGTGGQMELPVYGEVPAASFTSHTFEQVNLADLQGQVWVGDLIFTTCSGPCLRMTSSMYTLQEDLKGEDQFRLISISVDPDRDTPERLAWYAGQTLADNQRWSFLTASMDVVRSVATEGLKLVVDHNVEGEEFGILHSDRFVLVDAAGQIRGYYDGMDPAAMDQLKKDARALLQSL